MDIRYNIAVIVLALVPLATSNVTITYRLDAFMNNEGERFGGARCDPPIFFKDCDTLFHFCFDEERPDGQEENFYHCTKSFTTGEYRDQNTVHFHDHDLTGGVVNPLTLKMESFPYNGIRMKLLVLDVDELTADDTIDKYFENYDLRVYGWEEEVDDDDIRKVYIGKRPSSKTSLVVYIKAQCDPYWYGSRCTINCPVPRTFDPDSEECVAAGASGNQASSGTGTGTGTSHGSVVDTENNAVNQVPLIIGLVCGIALAILVVIIAVAIIYRYKKKQTILQTQGVNTQDTEARFDNPVYSNINQRPSTASTNALIPGGTGTQAGASTGSQGTQAGFATGVVMKPPPYNNRRQEMATNVQSASPNSVGTSCGGGNAELYDSPRPTNPPEYQPSIVDDEQTYEAMALPPKTRRY